MKRLLVTGDAICDCNLYRGDRATSDSASKRGFLLRSTDGGAWLLRDMIAHLANSKEGGQEVVFGLAGTSKDLPKIRNSYCLWSPHAASNDPKGKKVWRAEQPLLGYGFDPADKQHELKPNPALDLGDGPDVIVFDEAGIAFRHADPALWFTEASWQDRDKPRWVILKVNGSIVKSEEDRLQGRKDFLDRVLTKWGDRLVLILPADLLRRFDVRIGHGLAWEESVEDLTFELHANPLLRRFAAARHLIVTFGPDAAYWRSTPGPDSPGDGFPRLVFDAKRAEGEWVRQNGTGGVFGYASCMAAALAGELAKSEAPCFERALSAGLSAARVLYMEGHGADLDMPTGFPFEPLAKAIDEELARPTAPTPASDFVSVRVPAARDQITDRGQWSLLDGWHYHALESARPRAHFEVALAVAVLGPSAFHNFPVAQFGKLQTVDRQEIESLRTIRKLIVDYVEYDKGKKPLCIGVFGPPGAGKSFGVNEIAMSVLGIKEEDIITFNLSQFSDERELVGAFHRIRDQRLRGKTPFVFWDEFDAKDYKWLQYLLAPMQDGVFQDGQTTHPIGKCIFVFAGATSPTYDEFGPVDPLDPSKEIERQDRPEAERRWREFVLKKGPDFKTRLAGYLNVLGPNPRRIMKVEGGIKCQVEDSTDLCWPIRRALFIRGQYGLDKERLELDYGVLRGLLEIPHFKAGSRSLEFLCRQLKPGSELAAGHRSSLPGHELLGMHVNAHKFWSLVSRDRAFEIASERLAPGLHAAYSATPGILDDEPDVVQLWNKLLTDPPIKPLGQTASPEERLELGMSLRAANYAQAAGIPAIIRLAGYRCVPGGGDPQGDRKLLKKWEPLRALFAEAEHNRWMVERMLDRWTFSPIRHDLRRWHPDLVPFTHLPVDQKIKDEWLILGRPAIPATKTEPAKPAIPDVLKRLRAIGWTVEKIPEPKGGPGANAARDSSNEPDARQASTIPEA